MSNLVPNAILKKRKPFCFYFIAKNCAAEAVKIKREFDILLTVEK